jgi:hypothetical protein
MHGRNEAVEVMAGIFPAIFYFTIGLQLSEVGTAAELAINTGTFAVFFRRKISLSFLLTRRLPLCWSRCLPTLWK